MRVHHLIFAFAAALALAPSAAFAQWGMRTADGGGISTHASSMGIIEYESRDWAQCVGAEQIAPSRAIAACGRIIAERYSREITVAGLYYRALLYKQQGDAEHARADLTRARDTLAGMIRSEPRGLANYERHAEISLLLDDMPAAFEDYVRIAEINGDSAQADYLRGASAFRQHDYAEAIRFYDAAADAKPSSAAYHAGRCEARAAAAVDLEAARSACEEAVRISGGSAEALFSRGYLNFREGRIEDALADFRAALERDNTNAFAAYGYGVVGTRLGHEQEGQTMMEQASAAVPDVLIYQRAGLTP